MSQIYLSGAFGDFLFYVILSIYLLAGVDNRNVIITQRFHAATDQANRDFFWSLTAYCNCKYFSTFLLPPLRPAERERGGRGGGAGVLKVLREENAFVLHYQHGRRDVMWKPKPNNLSLTPKLGKLGLPL